MCPLWSLFVTLILASSSKLSTAIKLLCLVAAKMQWCSAVRPHLSVSFTEPPFSMMKETEARRFFLAAVIKGVIPFISFKLISDLILSKYFAIAKCCLTSCSWISRSSVDSSLYKRHELSEVLPNMFFCSSLEPYFKQILTACKLSAPVHNSCSIVFPINDVLCISNPALRSTWKHSINLFS